MSVKKLIQIHKTTIFGKFYGFQLVFFFSSELSVNSSYILILLRKRYTKIKNILEEMKIE